MKIISYIRHPYKFFFVLSKKGVFNWLPDKLYISLLFRHYMRYWINWNSPHTFNEKLNWLKLNNRNPLYTTLVDKESVKKWVSDKIGAQHVIPTLGIWNKFEDINFDKLPNQFVLKCTHDSGGLVICTNKSTLDVSAAREKINNSLKRNFYYQSREWPYKNVKPQIIAEKYMEDEQDAELRDYKFYTFNGEPRFLLLATNRQCENKPLCFDYFDMDFNHLQLTNHWHPNNPYEVPHKPQNFEKMKEFAKILAKDIPHVRVDFYEVNGQVYFGEMTFFDMGGFLKLHPDSWERDWGDLIKIS